MTGAGKTVAERMAAAVMGLIEKAGRGESAFGEWRKMSGLMQRGERGVERARDALESAGERLSGQLQRLSQPVVQRHEMPAVAERAHEQRQHEKELTEARSRQRSYDGPSLAEMAGKQGSSAFTLKPDVIHRCMATQPVNLSVANGAVYRVVLLPVLLGLPPPVRGEPVRGGAGTVSYV